MMTTTTVAVAGAVQTVMTLIFGLSLAHKATDTLSQPSSSSSSTTTTTKNVLFLYDVAAVPFVVVFFTSAFSQIVR